MPRLVSSSTVGLTTVLLIVRAVRMQGCADVDTLPEYKGRYTLCSSQDDYTRLWDLPLCHVPLAQCHEYR